MMTAKSNICSIKPSTILFVVLIFLLSITLLSACRGETVSPTPTKPAATQPPAATDTQSPTQTQTETVEVATEEPSVPQATLVRTTAAPQPDAGGQQPTTRTQPTVGPTRRATATPKPVSTYVFPTDESGFPTYPTDDNGVPFFPEDESGNPIIATDESGYPIFPIDEEGNFIIPNNPQGTPLYPTDEYGFPIIEEFMDEEFPTDEFPVEDLPTDETEPDVTQEPDDTGFPTTVPGFQPRSTRTPLTGDTNDSTSEPEPSFTRTPIVWSTPSTNLPVGHEINPLVIGVPVLRQEDMDRLPSMEALANRLAEDTGLAVRVQPTSSFAELLNGMRAGVVHAAWLQPFTYIIAHQRGYADVVMVTNHFGLEAYGTMFLANSNLGLTPYFDAVNNKSTVGADEALQQFADLRPCWVDPLSASGYVVPAGLLADNGVNVKDSVFLMSHTGVIRALYVGGICDFGAVFGISGDPRTASVIQQDLPDVMNRVKAIWQTDPIIPSLNLSVQARLPEATRIQIIDALIDLVQTDDGKQMLTDATGYDIRGLREVEDTFYQPLRDLLYTSGINARTLLGK